MTGTIISWMIAVPLSDPWRAIVVVAEVITLALVLHLVWKLAISLGGRLRHVNSRLNGHYVRSPKVTHAVDAKEEQAAT